MGCGGSVGKAGEVDEALARSEASLAEERRRLQEKDLQIAHVQRQLQSTEEATSARAAAALLSTEDLRAELRAHHEESFRELERQRAMLVEQHREELRSARLDREAALARSLGERAEMAHESLKLQHEMAERSHRALVESLRDAAEAAVARHREEATGAERELRRLRDEFGPLRREHQDARDSLAEARALLHSEQSERAQSVGRTSALESRLAEARDEHRRSEQRYADLEFHLKAQMRDLQAELRSRTEELQQRNELLRRRDEELAEVNGQLADLQSLFDDVNRQLQNECGRIAKLQETVALCAKQSQELEQLQGMLEDSHRMLAQVRDALEEERAERSRAAGLLEHEQQRTQLLLDVLKHFKEKLQGLTPQALLNRLGAGSDAKALLASAGVLSPQQQSFSTTAWSGGALGVSTADDFPSGTSGGGFDSWPRGPARATAPGSLSRSLPHGGGGGGTPFASTRAACS